MAFVVPFATCISPASITWLRVSIVFREKEYFFNLFVLPATFSRFSASSIWCRCTFGVLKTRCVKTVMLMQARQNQVSPTGQILRVQVLDVLELHDTALNVSAVHPKELEQSCIFFTVIFPRCLSHTDAYFCLIFKTSGIRLSYFSLNSRVFAKYFFALFVFFCFTW